MTTATLHRPLRFRDLVRPFAPTAAPVPPQRKDQASLSEDERGFFLLALNTLLRQGTYAQLVAIHSDMTHTMHNMGDGSPEAALGQQRFLPWHRVYLYQFERQLQRALRDQVPVTVPYWNWETAQEQSIPGWLEDVLPTVAIGAGTISVFRSPRTQENLEQILAGTADPSVPSLATVKKATTYTDFASGLEGVHNLVHDWVGGTMDSLATASADPIFWMHHANLDRLWWEWHQGSQGQGLDPQLSGVDAIMDPWRYDEPQTRDIANFNYSYV
jgi:tyrosinase